MLKKIVLTGLLLTIIIGCAFSVAMYTETYKAIKIWGSTGSGDGQFTAPTAMAIGSWGNLIVLDAGNNRVQVFKADGTFLKKWAIPLTGGFVSQLNSLAVDSSGNIFVCDAQSNRVYKYTADGTPLDVWYFSKVAGDTKMAPSFSNIVVDHSGNLYLTDKGNDCVKIYNSSKNFVKSFGGTGQGDGQLSSPTGIALDQAGNIYVADYENNRIQKFSADGGFLTKWGTKGSDDGQFQSPCSVAIDTAGNVYVGDRYNYRIQKFTSNGDFLLKWGSKGTGNGQFQSNMEGIVVTVDSSGFVYAANYDNRIQKFQFAKWPTSSNQESQTSQSQKKTTGQMIRLTK